MIDKTRALEALGYVDGVLSGLLAVNFGKVDKVQKSDVQPHIDALREFITDADDCPLQRYADLEVAADVRVAEKFKDRPDLLRR